MCPNSLALGKCPNSPFLGRGRGLMWVNISGQLRDHHHKHEVN
jgi:hypothetical protein